ncbi:MAG: hypothetical protein ABSE73_16220 [Planctomycetota bacterium]
MPNKWTREQIIRHILQCEAEGLPLTVGEPGISQALYQAGTRIFGSWRNALQAAGIPPERGNCGKKWPPAKILMIIRNLSRRHRPLTTTQLERRYGNMLSAARRLFGSWSKAVLAAGVDPMKLQRVVPWTRERVIEAILTRALRNESLAARVTRPRSLVDAGRRFFGSWVAAVKAAGLDPNATVLTPASPPSQAAAMAPATDTEFVHRPRQPWTREVVVAAIQARLRQQKPLNARALRSEDRALYSAGKRRFSNWSNALLAAGLNPDDHQRTARRMGRFEISGTPDGPAQTTGQPHPDADQSQGPVFAHKTAGPVA